MLPLQTAPGTQELFLIMLLVAATLVVSLYNAYKIRQINQGRGRSAPPAQQGGQQYQEPQQSRRR